MQPSEPSEPDRPILREGETCWRLAPADRVAFLIDGKAYFDALAATLRRARRSILILGWDIDSRVTLEPEGGEGGAGVRLADFLEQLVVENPELRIHVLIWDFSMIYAMEREPLPVFQFGWKTHERIVFASDGEHPLGGSQHQKIVVVDDRVAFAGGLDLTKVRWDTPEHRPEDPRRRDPAGEPYDPFHDIQGMVDGRAARSLGDLARRRWKDATGEALEAPPADGPDTWPEAVTPDVENVRVGIARTMPAYKARPAVEEVKRLYVAAIAAARECIYIENQYFTSVTVRKALAERLEAEDGPEVVIVLPRKSSGWLEETAMDTLRGWQLQRLTGADRHGRLRVCYPANGGAAHIKVHAKLMIVDDRLVRLGSANLSNRSMGLDSECDLALEAGPEDEDVRAAIGGLRERLLAEHLDTDPETVARALGETGSLVAAVDRLRGEGRTLRPVKTEELYKLPFGKDADSLLDPEQPVELDAMMDALLRDERAAPGPGRARLAALAGVVLAAAGLAAFWNFTSIGQQIDPARLVRAGAEMTHMPLAGLWVLAIYVLGSAVMFPITLLIGATASVFDPLLAFVYALGGSLAAALVTYGMGSLLGRKLVRRMAGGSLNRLSRRLAERGVTAVVVARLLPIAPFTLLNIVAGASHIRLKDFVLGTLLGMLPGIAVVTLVVDRVKKVLLAPTPFNVGALVGIGVAAAVAGWWLRRRMRRRGAKAS